MQCTVPHVVPVHDCKQSNCNALKLKDWVALSAGVHTCAFVVKGEGVLKMLCAPQGSTPAIYHNELLSDDDWVWKGNVVVAHESGKVTGELVEWVLTNMETLRYMLKYRVEP
jgi:hypothetical protein